MPAQRAGFGHDLNMRHLPDLIVEEPGTEPEHADEVVDAAAETVPNTVFRNAAHARAVIHVDLHHARAAELAERGEEAVHVLEHGQSFQCGAAISLQRAA